jgi:hypothetical protein
MPIIVWIIGTEVYTRSADRRLVSVHGVVSVETEHLLGNLLGTIADTIFPVTQQAKVG